jgi:hypothetical protein
MGGRIEMVSGKFGGKTLRAEGNGNFLTILKRQIDDSWKIAMDCFNHTTPLVRAGETSDVPE